MLDQFPAVLRMMLNLRIRINILLQAIRLFLSVCLFRVSRLAQRQKNFFEGLLPEGFARKCVANWIHTSEDDYLTILSVLGSECLGALRVSDNIHDSGDYKPLSIESVKALAKEGVSKSTELITEAHLSLTGASGKVGLYYDPERNM